MKVRLLIIYILHVIFISSAFGQVVLRDKKYFEDDATIEEKVEILLDSSANNVRSNNEQSLLYAEEAMKYAQKSKSNDLLMKAHFRMGEVYRNSVRNEEARTEYNEAIKYAKKINDQLEIAKLNKYKAHTFAAEGNFKEAISSYKAIKEAAEILKDTSLLGDAHLDIGVIYARKGEYYVAVEYFFQSLELYEAVDDNRYIMPILNNIGAIYQDNKEYDNALIYFEKAQKQFEKTGGDDRGLVSIFLNIGAIYKNKKQYGKAFSSYEKALEKAKETNASELIAQTELSLGKLYLVQDNFQKAMELSKKATEYFQRENLKDDLSKSLLQMATADRLLGNYSSALNYANRAKDLNLEVDALSNWVNIYEELAKIHDELGNHKKAYNYLEEYTTIKDSLVDVDKAEAFVQLEAKYNYEQEELLLTSEINLLKKDKRLQRSRQIVLLLVLVSILIALMALFWVFKNNKKKTILLEKDLENKAVIEEQAAQLRVFNSKLEETVAQRTAELEQANYELRTFNYIASHDIKEPIRVIGGYSGLIFKRLPKELKESLGDYFDTIKRSTGQLYNLIEDFAHYISMSKDSVIENQEIDLNFSVSSVIDNIHETIEKSNGQINYTDLPTIQSNSFLLFTIIKNLIENGLKYNQSETPIVNIDYKKTETHHTIIFSDNGIGIRKEYYEQIFEMFKRLHARGLYEGSGIGLAIVKLSVTKLDGEILVESEEGKGSQFTIRLPIN